MPALKSDERIYETTTTVGTGEYTLLGAVTGFQAASVIGANNYAPFFITDDTNWEAIIGTYVSGPSRVQRTHVVKSSNGGAAVNWGAGTKKIRCGWPAWLALPRVVTKSVAGSSNVTLSALECCADLLVLTGAITANINVIVDDTPRKLSVFNNTSGAFTVTVKTSGGSGKVVRQGKYAELACDGTNIVYTVDDSLQASDLVLLSTQTASGASQVDFTGIDSSYDVHILEFTDVTPGTDAQTMNLRVSTDNGASFLSTSIYSYVFVGCTPPSSSYSNGLAAQATMQINGSSVGNQTGEYISGSLKFNGLAGATRYKGVSGLLHQYSASPVMNGQMLAGVFLTTTAINALRLYMTSGTISGKFSLYGVKK